MALNMYFKNGLIRKTRYQISDELIPTLYQVHDNASFPKLTWLINHMYDNPEIQPNDAQLLADELVDFERLILSLHLPFPRQALQNLHGFFMASASKQAVVYTCSV